MNLVERIDELERKLEGERQSLDAVKSTVAKVEGQPIIKATHGSQLWLNGNLDVLLLNRRIAELSKRLEELKSIKASARSGEGGAGLKIEAGRNIEFEEDKKTKATIIHAGNGRLSSIPLNGG